MDNLWTPDKTEPKSWWEKKYPDGLISVWHDHESALMSNAGFQFLDTFRGLPSAGSIPNFAINLGRWGTHTFQIDPVVWGFIRACMLFSTMMLCRRIVFGG